MRYSVLRYILYFHNSMFELSSPLHPSLAGFYVLVDIYMPPLTAVLCHFAFVRYSDGGNVVTFRKPTVTILLNELSGVRE